MKGGTAGLTAILPCFQISFSRSSHSPLVKAIQQQIWKGRYRRVKNLILQ